MKKSMQDLEIIAGFLVILSILMLGLSMPNTSETAADIRLILDSHAKVAIK